MVRLCQTSPEVGDDTSSPCAYHPGRAPVERFGELPLCDECRVGRTQAARSFAPAFPYAECCVARAPNGAWSPLVDRAPAHWLAHELRAKARPGGAACAFGHPIDLDDLLRTRRPIEPPTPLCAGDLWIDLDGNRCGLVTGVDRRDGLRVQIRHLDPEQGCARVVDFYEAFDGRGEFHR